MGCGDAARNDVRTTAATPTAIATPEATASPVVAAPTATPTAAPTATPPAQPEPDAGDEDGNRVPVRITLAVEDVVPAEIEIPAFLGLRLTVRNESGSERILKLDDVTVLEILPGAVEQADVEGLSPGEHVLTAGESGRLRLVAERAG